MRSPRASSGRFGAGLPRVNDGSLLFLQHMISKFEPVLPDQHKHGSRLAIVFSGSPLFIAGTNDAVITGSMGSSGTARAFSMARSDCAEVLRALAADGIRIGLISNSHRCLASFQAHFELEGLFSAAVSSAEHGYMKPHPSIFETALQQAAAEPSSSVMVGDSVAHDVEGARRLGMRAVLVSRAAPVENCPADVPVIRTLRELPPLL